MEGRAKSTLRPITPKQAMEGMAVAMACVYEKLVMRKSLLTTVLLCYDSYYPQFVLRTYAYGSDRDYGSSYLIVGAEGQALHYLTVLRGVQTQPNVFRVADRALSTVRATLCIELYPRCW
jgi:hypothetical protein